MDSEDLQDVTNEDGKSLTWRHIMLGFWWLHDVIQNSRPDFEKYRSTLFMVATETKFGQRCGNQWLWLYGCGCGRLEDPHYIDVIMGAMASQITKPHDCLLNGLSMNAQMEENIKAPRHWPLWGEFTGDRWIPHTKGQ